MAYDFFRHAFVIYFYVAMIFVVFCDIYTMKIPNRLCFSLVIVYFFAAYCAHMSFHDVLIHLVCGLVALLFGFILFNFRFIGGGDAKLAAATVLWLGFDPLATYACVSAIVGGIITVGLLIFRRLSLPAFLSSQGWIVRLHDPKEGVPYGVALVIGGIVAYGETPILRGW